MQSEIIQSGMYLVNNHRKYNGIRIHWFTYLFWYDFSVVFQTYSASKTSTGTSQGRLITITELSQQVRQDELWYCCWDFQNWRYCFFIGEVKMCLMSHWLIIFNIRVSSCPCEFRTDVIFLWIKISSGIQTLSAAHIKEKISNLPLNINIDICYFGNSLL